MKKIPWMVLLALLLVRTPLAAAEQKAEKSEQEDTVVKTYTLRYESPKFIQEALKIYMYTCSFGEGSNLISVVLPKRNVAVFEEQLRKLDVEKKTVLLRIFTVIAAREGKSGPIENKDLKKVLAEVSNLLSFNSYTLDGASTVTAKDGAQWGRVALSTSLAEELQFDFSRLSIATGSSGKRSVKLAFNLTHVNSRQELLSSDTEIVENGYLLAGVSRIGREGKSLVLVINAEIK